MTAYRLAFGAGRVQALSDALVASLEGAGVDVAVVACLDAAVRVLKSRGFETIVALETLERTLEQIKDAERQSQA